MHNITAAPAGKSVLPEMQNMIKDILRKKANG
jgi:hypothetical protein